MKRQVRLFFWRIGVTFRWLEMSIRYREWPWRVPWATGMIVRNPSPEVMARARALAEEKGW